MKNILLLLIIFGTMTIYAQVGIGTTNPSSSTMLDVQSSTSGFAMPRMNSTDRLNIANPVPGLQVYDTDYKAIWFYDGNEWRSVGPLAYGRINPDGTATRIVGASVSHVGTGHYKITFDKAMPTENYMISLSLRKEKHERYDITIFWQSLTTTGFDVYVQDNDNGYDIGIPTDNMFMFIVTY